MSENLATEITEQIADSTDNVKKIITIVVTVAAATAIGGYAYRKIQQKRNSSAEIQSA